MSSSRPVVAPTFATRFLAAGVCAPFWLSGIDKLLDVNATAREMADIGLTHPELVAFAVIVVQLGGSLLSVFARGVAAAAGALALAAFTLIATWVAHAFWTLHGHERIGEMNIFIEHIAIVFGLALAAWTHLRLTRPAPAPVQSADTSGSGGPSARASTSPHSVP